MTFQVAGSLRLGFLAVPSLITFAFLLGSPDVYGQGRHTTPSPPPTPPGSVPNPLDQNNPLPTDTLDLYHVTVIDGDNGKPIATNEYACFLPPLNSVSPGTVGVVDLQVPLKSKDDYQSACRSLQKKKIADAEKHLREAVVRYEKYAAAWVLLGQLLETQQKLDEARDACSKSLNASASYLPGYLCLTDISTRQEAWLDALKFSARALEIDPAGNPAAYALNAGANLELHHLAAAEASALKAAAMDVKNSEPRVHYLLAQIYAAKGDRTQFVAQLREFLKYAKDPADVAVAKNILAKVDGQAQQ